MICLDVQSFHSWLLEKLSQKLGKVLEILGMIAFGLGLICSFLFIPYIYSRFNDQELKTCALVMGVIWLFIGSLTLLLNFFPPPHFYSQTLAEYQGMISTIKYFSIFALGTGIASVVLIGKQKLYRIYQKEGL